jgi:hypothetical protein
MEIVEDIIKTEAILYIIRTKMNAKKRLTNDGKASSAS